MTESKDAAIPGIMKSAVLSPCGRYRYRLTRCWNPLIRQLVIVMLNPSTADAEFDDPTIVRCMGFARSTGHGGIIVYNLYAFRATSPFMLKLAMRPFGDDNNEHLSDAIARCATGRQVLLCAWGSHKMAIEPGKDLVTTLAQFEGRAGCLGKTKHGYPRHPLYVRASTTFEPYP